VQDLFLIAKGECECYVRDENKRERFVSVLVTGQHFGEIAFLTSNKRTATIQTKNYSTLGKLAANHFKDLCRIYPDMKSRLRSSLHLYKDHYKEWQKTQLQNVAYFQDLSLDCIEYLNYKINHIDYDEGEIIFKNAEPIDYLYILANGEVEVYVTTADEDLLLDTFKVNGSLMGQFTILDSGRPITYSARTISQVSMLRLSIHEIEKCAENFKELQMSLRRVRERLNASEWPILDYQINRKSPRIGALLEETKFEGLKLLQQGVNKLLKVQKYKRKKAFKFKDLIAFLKKHHQEKVNHANEEQLALI